MKRPPQSKSKAKSENLPSFLDEASSEADATAVAAAHTGAPADGDTAALMTSATADDGEARSDVALAGDADGETVAASAADATADSGPAPSDASEAPPDAPEPTTGGRGEQATAGALPLLLLGATGVAAGIAASFVPALHRAVTALVEPSVLVLAGVVGLAAGATRRHLARLEHGAGQRQAELAALQQDLRLLVDAHHAAQDKPPAEGEELQHVLMAMQRQDEKINNLTRAIKMYGKPLMEIAGQGTELAGGVASVRTLVEAGNEATRLAVARIETQLRTPGTGKQDLAELQAAVQKVAARVEALATAKPSFEPVQQQLGRVEVGLAAVAQRLEDNEVRKSLMRLEETTQKGRDAVQELLRGESVQKATNQLKELLDKATKGLADGMQQLRDGNLGGLEQAVREIQREVSGVATSVAQINAAMRSGARPAAAATAAAQSPTASPAAPTTAAPPNEAEPRPKPAAAGDKDGAYQTGTRSTGGKNVLGAIAKLKQMKG